MKAEWGGWGWQQKKGCQPHLCLSGIPARLRRVPASKKILVSESGKKLMSVVEKKVMSELGKKLVSELKKKVLDIYKREQL